MRRINSKGGMTGADTARKILDSNGLENIKVVEIFSAIFTPSIADVVIPPAYPAPSPQGYNPSILETPASFLTITIGELVLLSIPRKNELLQNRLVNYYNNIYYNFRCPSIYKYNI